MKIRRLWQKIFQISLFFCIDDTSGKMRVLSTLTMKSAACKHFSRSDRVMQAEFLQGETGKFIMLQRYRKMQIDFEPSKKVGPLPPRRIQK
jgi:hypothetical protein